MFLRKLIHPKRNLVLLGHKWAPAKKFWTYLLNQSSTFHITADCFDGSIEGVSNPFLAPKIGGQINFEQLS